jgi:hypothetical protein
MNNIMRMFSTRAVSIEQHDFRVLKPRQACLPRCGHDFFASHTLFIRETPNSQVPAMEIVGVVGDARWQDPSQPAPPVIFRAAMQGTGDSPSILLRTSLDEASIVPTLRRILNDADPTVPVE